MNESIIQLKQWIEKSNHIIAFTGAGISTESGIPDFRSSGGLYTTGVFQGMQPETILTRKTLRQNPGLVLRFYRERLLRMVDKEPNRSHFALKRLEDAGKLKATITQNIDNLHPKAGSKRVFELHGNGTRFKCFINCGETYTYEEYINFLDSCDKPMCKCNFSFIRPDVVLFDESLDDDVFDGAYYETKKCDLMIAIGSSLAVQPAASLLSEIPTTAKLVIINDTRTPYDTRADLVINGNCGDILEQTI
jgi:NAD-dependent deacetylase